MSDSMSPDPSGAYPPAQQQSAVPPQQQYPAPQPSMPAQAPSQPASSGGGKPLLFGGIGVVVGLLIGVLAGSMLLGGGDAGSGPDADAQAACGYVAVNLGQVDEESIALSQPQPWQLQAAGGLAQAAAAGEATYEAFGEQGMDLLQAVNMQDIELAQSTLDSMDQSCADF